MIPIPASLISLFAALAALLLGTPLLMRCLHLTPREAGWRWEGWRTLGLGVGWGGLLGVLEIGWLRLLLHTGNYLPIPIAPTLPEWLLLALALPLAEECFFRGVIFSALQRGWRPVWAVLLSALCYLAAHAADPWLAFVFLNGIGYALAFRQSRALAAPLLAHMLVVAVLLTARIYPATTADLPLATLGALALLALLLLLWAGRKKGEGWGRLSREIKQKD
jgi:membrane protease YdiL (CAAX protease family)